MLCLEPDEEEELLDPEAVTAESEVDDEMAEMASMSTFIVSR